MISKAWQKFWFDKQSPMAICLFRIFFGFFLLQRLLVEWAPNFRPFLGVHGLVQAGTLSLHWWQKKPVFDIFLLLPQDDIYRLIIFCAIVIAALFVTAGFCTRLSTIIVYLGILSMDKQCPLALNGSDDFLRVVSFMLIFSPAGAMYSLDSFLQNAKSEESKSRSQLYSPWAQRMIQVQLSLAYLTSFLCKLSGYHWQHGMAVYYVAHLEQFQKFSLPWLTNHAPGYQILTYCTLFVELSMATLVWYKPWRYWILLAGLLMHVGIDWTMNLPYFEFLFVSTYITFIDPGDLIKLGNIYRLLWSPFKINWQKALDAGSLFSKYRFNIGTSDWQNSYWFFPTLFSCIIIILILGSEATRPLRLQFAAAQSKMAYAKQLYQAQVEKQAEIQRCEKLPDTDERKLGTQESLAITWSLLGEYQKACAMLRHVCKSRLEQNTVYNAKLMKSMSYLGDIYLETGHLDASELCYQTMLNYDLTHAPKDNLSPAIDLNNLAVIGYFRSLNTQDKTAKYLALEKTNNSYIQALDKLHLSNLSEDKPVVSQQQRSSALAAIDILSNKYLSLRDSYHVKECHSVKTRLAKLRSKFI